MPATTAAIDAVSQRLRELAHKRLAYYSELSRTGRWTLYFSEREIIDRLRDVIAVTNAWHEMAGRKPSGTLRDVA